MSLSGLFGNKQSLPARYVGRFAPAPTGRLHFGSLITAVGSYLQARSQQGHWLLRIEDLDQPREVPGAAESIQQTLAAIGFEWHGPIVRQSQRLHLYQQALETLRQQHLIYACTCSRSQLVAQLPAATESIDELPYPGFCRTKSYPHNIDCALRFLVSDSTLSFTDLIQGAYQQAVTQSCGDFVVRRRDGVFAYHLAVVVDDAEQGVNEIVRGADLLASTPRQMLLQRALSLPTPQYCHLPLAVDGERRKLSKSSQSLEIDVRRAPEVLWRALEFLQQSPPHSLRYAQLSEIWSWAIQHWQLATLRGQKQLLAPATAAAP